MSKILICDDEKDIVNAVKIYLSSNPEYQLLEASNGQEAVDIVKNGDIDLVLMDIMMPVMDGIEALSEIRKFSNIPIILLTAKSEDTDVILGLNVGADDYITKPFNPMEVVARVNSQLRRFTRLGASAPDCANLIIGGIEINDDSKICKVDGEEKALTPKEFEILKLLMVNPGKVFTPRDIYGKVWNEAALSGCEKTVAVHIRHLREKIEITPNDPRYIKVIFGQGYKIEKGRN